MIESANEIIFVKVQVIAEITDTKTGKTGLR